MWWEERDAASVCCSLGFAERLFQRAHNTAGFTSAAQTHTDQHPTFIQAQNNLYFIYVLSSGEAGALLEESGSLEVRQKSENLCSKDKN